MPAPTKGPRLASGPTHQKHLIRGMIASLIVEDRIRTTEAKARLVAPYAEKLVTLGKTDTLHARRQALKWITDDDIVHKLFAEVAPRFHDRNGGYTRILKLGPRKGDAAPMAILEFVEETASAAAPKETEAARKRRLGRRKTETTEEAKPKARARKGKDEDAEESAAPAKAGETEAKAPPVEEAPAEAEGDTTKESE
ncbi:MAG TPA: 50S ribosomal protein L17 [Actinomycetota bacterium]|nr:50S ribosomal protein L17 [Actinomycetota bacterium]